jgi:hypothetical protein
MNESKWLLGVCSMYVVLAGVTVPRIAAKGQDGLGMEKIVRETACGRPVARNSIGGGGAGPHGCFVEGS